VGRAGSLEIGDMSVVLFYAQHGETTNRKRGRTHKLDTQKLRHQRIEQDG
jgi:hypothetical protein